MTIRVYPLQGEMIILIYCSLGRIAEEGEWIDLSSVSVEEPGCWSALPTPHHHIYTIP
jgi:hypothetical protein